MQITPFHPKIQKNLSRPLFGVPSSKPKEPPRGSSSFDRLQELIDKERESAKIPTTAAKPDEYFPATVSQTGFNSFTPINARPFPNPPGVEIASKTEDTDLEDHNPFTTGSKRIENEEDRSWKTLQSDAKKALENGYPGEHRRLLDAANKKRHETPTQPSARARKPVEELGHARLTALLEAAKATGNIDRQTYLQRLLDEANRARRENPPQEGKRRKEKDDDRSWKTLQGDATAAGRRGDFDEQERLSRLSRKKRRASKGTQS